jgi:glycosyltransferase involved in cell wall biosynthesis
VSEGGSVGPDEQRHVCFWCRHDAAVDSLPTYPNGWRRLTEGFPTQRSVGTSVGLMASVELAAWTNADEEVAERKTVLPAVSVVVPLLNEEPTLSTLYDQLADVLGEDEQWEVVFVDDGSRDGSYAELVRLHAEHDNVRVVRLRRNFGKAAALSVGFEQARGDLIVTLDADLQDNPAEIPRLLAKLDEGFDLVSGWKRDRQDPVSRRIFSRVYNRTTSLITGVNLHDMNCGLKAYRAEVIHSLHIYGDLHRFVPVLADQRGYRVAEIVVDHRPRSHGRSRYGFERYLRGLFDLLTVTFLGRYRYRPLHFFGGVGLASGFLGSVILLYLAALKLAGAAIGGRPLLVLGVLLVIVGLQFVSIGLVGEMVTNLNEEKASTKDRARAYVRDVLS